MYESVSDFHNNKLGRLLFAAVSIRTCTHVLVHVIPYEGERELEGGRGQKREREKGGKRREEEEGEKL